MKDLCRELAQEHEALDEMIKDLSDSKWETITPFYDWTIKDEISHIAFFDDKANLAATDPAGFQRVYPPRGVTGNRPHTPDSRAPCAPGTAGGRALPDKCGRCTRPRCPLRP